MWPQRCSQKSLNIFSSQIQPNYPSELASSHEPSFQNDGGIIRSIENSWRMCLRVEVGEIKTTGKN